MKHRKNEGIFMKKKFLVLAIFSVLGLAGCSQSIPKEYYDEVIAERNELQKKLDEADEKLSLLQKDYDTFKSEYETKLVEYTEQLASDLPLTTAQAWIDASFSGIGTCSSYEDTLFVSILTGKEISKENVSLMWNEFINAIALYTTSAELSESLFSYQKISVAFFDENNNGIFQIDLDLMNNTKFNICVNALYASDIFSWISK